MTEDEQVLKEAKIFAKTLVGKPVAEQVGALMLAFDGMDIFSAKALVILSSLDKP